jgi:hypothetical protein
MKKLKLLFICNALLLFSSLSYGQADTISGQINQYFQVQSLDPATSILTLNQTVGLQPDDKVLLIQMGGAQINSNNNTSFGSITNLNGAGSYMFARLCIVESATNEVSLQETVDPTFASTNQSTSGIQLVKVPEYLGDVVVQAALTAPDWNGQTGGVLVLDAAGEITFNADINLDGKGFRGGTPATNNSSCTSFVPSPTDQFFSISDGNGGGKGEGIASFISNREAGRGPQANGGGGGNDHNTGGAGGANYGDGGAGGLKVSTGFFECLGTQAGRSGRSLSSLGYSSSNHAVFMGGGGGTGHDNNDLTPAGGDGGGIIMIYANGITGNNHLLSVNGTAPTGIPDSDGGSGGGAGGSIMLEVGSYTGNLRLEAKGGDGSDTDVAQCQGPGGGGGGGAIWTSMSLPGSVTTNVNGGAPGVALFSSCGNSPQGASSGAAGIVDDTYAQPIPSGTICVLPAFWIDFQASMIESNVKLTGIIGSSDDVQYAEVMRKKEGANWEKIEELRPSLPFSKTIEMVDEFPPFGKISYQILLKSFNGQTIPSPKVELNIDSRPELDFWIKESSSAYLELGIFQYDHPDVSLEIIDMKGKKVFGEQFHLSEGTSDKQIVLGHLSPGMYLIRLSSSGRFVNRKWIKS